MALKARMAHTRYIQSPKPRVPYGRQLYSDHEGADPQLVDVHAIEGDQVAVFLDAEDEDEGVSSLVKEMAGTFQPVR